MDAEQIKHRIEMLMPKAETGEQWAEICRLESERLALTACWLCDCQKTRKQHDGYGTEPAQYVCEGCFTSDEACFDDLEAA